MKMFRAALTASQRMQAKIASMQSNPWRNSADCSRTKPIKKPPLHTPLSPQAAMAERRMIALTQINDRVNAKQRAWV
jgi:hypothetical protein